MDFGRCEHFLHFLDEDRVVWVQLEEYIHDETQEFWLPTYRDTLSLRGLPPADNGYVIERRERQYELREIDGSVWIIAETYKIKFERLNTQPQADINRDSIFSILFSHDMETNNGRTEHWQGNRYVTDSTRMVQGDYGDPFEGKWRLVELGGLYFIDGQVSAPLLVTRLEQDTIHGLSLDYRYEPTEAIIKPTRIYFK